MLKLLLIIFVIAGCSQPDTKKYPQYKPNQKIFICLDENNQKIKIIATQVETRNRMMAVAGYNFSKNRREIRLAYNLIDKVPSNVLEFIAYHECGHHQLEHVNTTNIPVIMKLWSDKLKKIENDADCFAAAAYLHNNSRAKFDNLLKTLKTINFISFRRIKNIKRCSSE